MPNPTDHIKYKAIELGFSFCGFASCTPLPEWRNFYEDFIRHGGQAGFGYLETNLARRLDPSLLLPEAKSVIAVLQNYYPSNVIPEENNFIISKYAYGCDPYPGIKEKLNLLSGYLSQVIPGTQSRAFVDSGPVLEKVWAQRCGVGWQGKNSLIINKNAGSFFFIGILLTTAELTPDKPEKDHCGTCRRCIDACPTKALEKPYCLDIRKCISYYTIENKEEIPGSLKPEFRDRIFGCDICQDACPYNKFPLPSVFPDSICTDELMNMRKPDWLSLTEDRFLSLFKGSPVERTGYPHFMKMIRLNAEYYSPH